MAKKFNQDKNLYQHVPPTKNNARWVAQEIQKRVEKILKRAERLGTNLWSGPSTALKIVFNELPNRVKEAAKHQGINMKELIYSVVAVLKLERLA